MALKTESVAEATVDKGAEIYISDNLKSIKGKDNRSNRYRWDWNIRYWGSGQDLEMLMWERSLLRWIIKVMK